MTRSPKTRVPRPTGTTDAASQGQGLPNWGSQVVIISRSSATSHRGRDHVKFGVIPAQIGYKPRHATPPNINQYFRSSPAISTTKTLVRVLPAALHLPTQHGPNKACPRRAGRSPGWPATNASGAGPVWVGWGIPPTSPRATTWGPGGRATRGRCRSHRGLPPGPHVVGLRQVDGMPHGSQRARSSVVIQRRKRITTPNTPTHEATGPKREKSGRQT
jgi:hypothetical protein